MCSIYCTTKLVLVHFFVGLGITEKIRSKAIWSIAGMLTYLVVVTFFLFFFLRYFALSMSMPWLDRFLVDHALVAYFHLLHNFSPHINTQFNKSRTASWTDPVMLAEEWFGTFQLFRMHLKILANLAFAIGCRSHNIHSRRKMLEYS